MTTSHTRHGPSNMGVVERACPACGVTAPFEPLLTIPDVPVLANELWTTRQAALNAPRGDIALTLCAACGLLRNAAFDPSLVDYSARYENSLHFSPVFQDFARQLAQQLVDSYDLHGKDVVEIGSGKGEFLTLLCDSGAGRGFGFDAAYDGEVEGAPTSDRVTIVRDYYSDRYANWSADLVLARHLLEHIDDPRDFLDSIRSTIGDRTDTAFYIEVPDAAYMLEEMAIWDLIYEHCSYFAPVTLVRLLESTGFNVREATSSFGGQFLSVSGYASERRSVPQTDWNIEWLEQTAHSFAQHHARKMATWSSALENLRDRGNRVAVWGAGSKGITFLNTVPGAAETDLVIDVNPRKAGLHVPGTGHRIQGPDVLPTLPPDMVLVMNPLYLDEIKRQIADLDVAADVVAV